MASYNIRQRDPLIDSNLSAMINKRGRELAGLALIGLGCAFGVMLASYAPEDPSWMASTDAPVQNSLGRVGAAIASPLMIIAGLASWGVAAVLAGWGLRLVLSRGHETALARGVFAPIAVALTAVWAATLVPSDGWNMVYGMGGIFGDTVLGAVVNALPTSPSAGVTFMGVFMLAVSLAAWGFVLGVNRYEMFSFARFLLAGAVLIYAALVALMRVGLVGGLRAGHAVAQGTARRVAGRRAQQADARALRTQMQAMRHADIYGEGPVNEHWSDARPYAPGEEEYAPAHTHAQREPRRRAAPVIRAPAYGERAQPAPGYPERSYQEPGYHAAEYGHDDYPPDDYLHEDRIIADTPGYPGAQTAEPSGFLSRLKRLAPSGGARVDPADLEPELVENELGTRGDDLPPFGEARISARIADAIRHRKRSQPTLRVDPTFRPQPQPDPRLTAAHRPQHVAPSAAHIPPVSLTQSFEPALVAVPHWMQSAVADPEVAELAPVMRRPEPVAAAATMPAPVVREDNSLNRRVVNTVRRTPYSARATAEAQPKFEFATATTKYELPPLSLLSSPEEVTRLSLSDEALEENARMLENVLDDYGVRGEIVSVRPGPVVTQYELEPAPGLKASRVIGLADDIARSMSALSARVSTVPGRSIIGIELPNAHREKVVLREILSARVFEDNALRLPLALGKAIDGEPVVANLAKMPHLLIAGTTGSGKSVAINTMILSLLYKLSPEECRLIMIDPKMLELSVYDGIPHLLSPVVTDPKKAVVALKWVVGEMEDRYRKMSKMGVRNIEGYNGRVREALTKGEMFKRTVQTGFDDETGDPVFETEEFAPELLPYIVVIVDEMADLMMVAGKEIEACIQRLAQMARASGIHLIMATQRPSVDVITGTIKANFPTRISFQVTSKIDSRTILGEQGAEQLLGMGDMLYMAGGSRITRVHGPFVSDEEVEEIVNHLKSFGPPDYKSGVVDGPEGDDEADINAVLGLGGNTGGEDALYDQAVQVVIQDRKCSTSYIQRKLGIGYNKAARLVEQMEDQGLVTPANHVGKREILIPEQG